MRRRRPGTVEILLAFVLAALFYVSLYGELSYHDAARFAAQLSSGRFVYDLGHVLLEPAALLWHRYLGFGEPVMASQKHINTVATAAAIAIFYGLLLRLGTARWLAVFAAALVAGSCGIITLAPSAHFKLVTLPFATGALALLTGAETNGRARHPAVALAAGALLAVSAGFFAGMLTTPPFAGLALVAAARRGRGLAPGAAASGAAGHSVRAAVRLLRRGGCICSSTLGR